MVSPEGLRKLTRLAEKHHINLKHEIHEWPSAHLEIFKQVQALGRMNFYKYVDDFDSESAETDAPWKRDMVARATWIAKEASHLSNKATNETAWRHGLENAVTERLKVEVACLKCRGRLWRSEVEPIFTESGRTQARLEERRRNRRPCNCPLGARPRNSYEAGTSPLFADMVEETVVFDDKEITNQRPDRIFALNETDHIRRLLNQAPSTLVETNVSEVRGLVPSASIQTPSNPPLFPFLVLEAKSDSAPNSFKDIQIQSAFPIRSFLNLQKDFQSNRPSDNKRPEPLVWLLGNKGSDWRLYGCYLGLDRGSNITYNIHYLWSGDIAFKTGALQLLLLVDYVTDWARDSFRLSIVAQLTSLASGKSIDEVTLFPDSDIVSNQGKVEEWMSGTSAPAVSYETAPPSENEGAYPKSQRDIYSVRLPNTQYGVVRPVVTELFQFAGLRLTKSNLKSLLTLHPGRDSIDSSKRCARLLVHEITKWDEVLVTTGATLDEIERLWTNKKRVTYDPLDEGPGAEFFVVFEYRCFMDLSWEIVRELSCFAVSTKAFDVLLERAAFAGKRQRTKPFLETLRPCSSSLVIDAIECLRSGSPWQVLHSAMSSTLVSLCPEPGREQDDVTLPVKYLGLDYHRSLRIRSFIHDIMNMADRARRGKTTSTKRSSLASERQKFKAQVSAWEGRTSNRSFLRTSQRTTRIPDALHDPSECIRCKSSNQDLFGWKYWDQDRIPSPAAHGAVLVVSLDEVYDETQNSDNDLREELVTGQQHHEICLYVFDDPYWRGAEIWFPGIVEDLSQNDSVYHTIRHDPLIMGKSRAVTWNLPSPYRKTTFRQRWDIARWVKDLNDDEIPILDKSHRGMNLWTHSQMLLHFLRDNMTYTEALAALIRYRKERDGLSFKLDHLQYKNRLSLDTFWDKHLGPQRSRAPRPSSSERSIDHIEVGVEMPIWPIVWEASRTQ